MVRVDAMGYIRGLLTFDTYKASDGNGHRDFLIAGNGGTDHQAANWRH
jgi:hypothetical protein